MRASLQEIESKWEKLGLYAKGVKRPTKYPAYYPKYGGGFNPDVPPDPPIGYQYLLGADGAYLLGADGDYLLGLAA